MIKGQNSTCGAVIHHSTQKGVSYHFRKDNEFGILWERYIKENANAIWCYIPKFLQYQYHYAKRFIIEDLSFVIEENGTPLCICPLFLEKHGDHNLFTYSGSYLRSPLIQQYLPRRVYNRVKEECFGMIDKLALLHHVVKIMFILDPMSERISYNNLMRLNYIDSSINTYLVDLSLDKDKLWDNLRKSYKSLINGGKKKYETVFVDYSNPDINIYTNYKELHHKAAGRITRPQETWDLQYEMLRDDNAMLLGLKDNGKFCAFSYFFHHNRSVYYGSSSDDPDYATDVPLEHTIIWSAMEYYKNRGFNLLEVGWQQFGAQLYDHPSHKDVNISLFKRGFGGEVVSLYRGIKYYDREFMKIDLEHNVKQLLSEY